MGVKARGPGVTTAAVLSVLLVLNTATAFDVVVFGDVASESAHHLRAAAAPVKRDRNGTAYRTILKGGALNVTLRCPSGTSHAVHLSVRTDGDEVDDDGPLVTLLRGAWGGSVSADSYPAAMQMCYSGRANTGHACVEPVSLGRPAYATMALPAEMSAPCRSDAGERSLNVSFAAWSGGQRSGALYRAYLHESGLLVPPQDEEEGETPPLAPPRTSGPGAQLGGADPNVTARQLEFLSKEVTAGVAAMAAFQAYGTAWEDMVANGTAAAVLTGAIIPCGVPAPLPSNWTAEEWEDYVAHHSTSTNNNWFRGIEALAHAWRAAETTGEYARATGLLARVAAALDYQRRAQGLNGGFVAHPGSRPWVGGPTRANASGVLEGYGHMGFSAAFSLAGPALAASGMLDVLIDDDANPQTPNVTRWQAYAALFVGSRDFLLGHRGHAPNQDVADVLAAWLANSALPTLRASSRALPNATLLVAVHEAIGLTNTTVEPQARWFSPHGISMEPNGDLNGGFTAGYGDVNLMVDWLADVTGDAQVEAQAKRIRAALSMFRSVDSCYDAVGGPYRCLRLESVVSSRHAVMPSRVSYGPGLATAALTRKDPLAIRLAQLRLAHGDAFSQELSLKAQQCSPHFPDSLMAAVKWRDSFPALVALPATNVRLPLEPGQPDFAWADATAGMVVLQHTLPSEPLPRRMFAAVQWRHGFKSTDPGARNVANVALNNATRVHFSTFGRERVATVAQQLLSNSSGFRSINAFDFGGYAIGMNMMSAGGASLPFVLSPPFVGQRATDLISGRRFDEGLPEALQLAPQQAVALYVAALDPIAAK